MSRPIFLKQRSSIWFITLVVSLAVFTDVLFYGLIIPFLPTILLDRVGVPRDELQIWTSTLLGTFGGSMVVASPICGYLADHSKSRQAPLLFGLAAMACSTAMLHFGVRIWILIFARVFQGLAGSLLYSAGLALLYDSVGKDRAGEYMGYIILALTAGQTMGPFLGGLLYTVDKSAPFGLAYGILVVDLILRLMVIEKSSAEKYTIESGYGTMNEETTASNDVSTSTAKPADSRTVWDSPTFTLLKSGRIWTALYGWLVAGTLLSAFEGVIPIYVQSTFDWTAAGAGAAFIPLLIPNIGSPVFGRIVDKSKQGGRLLAASGFTLCVPFFVLLRLVDANTITAKVLLCVFLFFIGLGLAASGTPIMVGVGRTVDAIEAKHPGIFGSEGATAQAYGLYNCAFALGQLIGPLWAGGIKAALGWATMAWIFGLVSGVTGIVMGLFLDGWIGKESGSGKASTETEEQRQQLLA